VGIDHILLLLGLVLLAVWGGAWAYRVAFSRAALAKFQARESETAHSSSKQVSDTTSGPPADFSLWSHKRVEALKASLIEKAPAPAPVELAAEPAPSKLPKTATSFPLLGLLGAALCAFVLGLRAKRALSS
jgi:hypothetical protein